MMMYIKEADELISSASFLMEMTQTDTFICKPYFF